MCFRETNLKVKQCLDVTNALGEDEKSLSQFSGHILCEPPNNNLGNVCTTYQQPRYCVHYLTT